MATTKITTTTSRFEAAADAFKITEGSSGADTLIVDQSAYLFSGTGQAIVLDPNGAWTLNIQGWVTALNSGLGIYQTGGKDAFSLTVGADGTVFGGGEGVHSATTGAVTIANAGIIRTNGANAIEILNSSKATITNSGSIQGDTSGIRSDAFATSLNNTKSGRIVGDVDLLGSGKHSITNAGSIEGNIDSDGTDDVLTNSGSISGLINIGNGNNKFTNTGDIINSAYVAFGGNNDTATNSGLIFTSLLLGEGNNTVTNSGIIIEDVIFGNGNDTLTSSGKNSRIDGKVELGNGINKFSNAGTVKSTVTGGTGIDQLTNSGTISGIVTLGDDADIVTNSGSILQLLTGAGHDVVKNSGSFSSIDLGDGDDKYTGGAKNEDLFDSNDTDTINLGAGDDFYFAHGASVNFDGDDKIDGGAGIDTYSASSVGVGVKINIDTVAHSEPGFSGVTVAKNFASAITPTGVFVDDIVLGFENARGSGFGDLIFGNSAANEIFAFAGNDIVAGYAGNDFISGGNGLDTLIGGAGADRLFGEGDDDSFVYKALADSGVGIAKRDRINDFVDDNDWIMLAFDANTKVAGHQNFTFVGGAFATFTGTAGQLRAVYTVDGWMVEGDVTGDAKPDFQIEVIDTAHAITWNFFASGNIGFLQ